MGRACKVVGVTNFAVKLLLLCWEGSDARARMAVEARGQFWRRGGDRGQVGRIEREGWADPETLGLSLSEGKQLTAAIQTEIVRTQASMMGERFRCCGRCGSNLSSKGYRQVTFRSLFRDVPLRVRRFENCPCRGALPKEPRSFSALALEGGMVPELAYVTAKFAALAPFGKVADFLADLLPVGGAVNAGTVRNRTRRVGERIARLRPAGAADPEIDAVTPAAVIGLDEPPVGPGQRNFAIVVIDAEPSKEA